MTGWLAASRPARMLPALVLGAAWPPGSCGLPVPSVGL